LAFQRVLKNQIPMGQIVVETTNAKIITEKNDVYASIGCFLSIVWFDSMVCFRNYRVVFFRYLTVIIKECQIVKSGDYDLGKK
jgi:hypothetical protein